MYLVVMVTADTDQMQTPDIVTSKLSSVWMGLMQKINAPMERNKVGLFIHADTG